MVTHAFGRAEFEKMLLNGTIKDATVLACFGLPRLRNLL